MDKFGEKVTIIVLKKCNNINLKHTINLNIFYSWVLNMSILICLMFSIINIIKIILEVV